MFLGKKSKRNQSEATIFYCQAGLLFRSPHLLQTDQTNTHRNRKLQRKGVTHMPCFNSSNQAIFWSTLVFQACILKVPSYCWKSAGIWKLASLKPLIDNLESLASQERKLYKEVSLESSHLPRRNSRGSCQSFHDWSLWSVQAPWWSSKWEFHWAEIIIMSLITLWQMIYIISPKNRSRIICGEKCKNEKY